MLRRLIYYLGMGIMVVGVAIAVPGEAIEELGLKVMNNFNKKK